MTTIEKSGLTGKIQNELTRLGYKCRTTVPLVWFTDRPVHEKSNRVIPLSGKVLDEPYILSLGEKGAMKFYEKLKEELRDE